jgi:hypothetical protein
MGRSFARRLLFTKSAFAALLAGLLFPMAGRAGPILGQIDTFENNTSDGWMIGDPLARNPPVPGFTPPAIIPTGGPAGVGDHFMLLTADAARSGGRLTVFNRDQWAGNFLQAGVNLVEMDLENFGTTPLSMRIAIKAGTGIGSAGYVSTVPFVLPADGQWHHASFLLDPESLTAIGAAPPLATLLSNVAEFRILNSARPALNGDDINSQVGIDNIAALEIHEPGGFLLLFTGCVVVWGWRCGRRRG